MTADRIAKILSGTMALLVVIAFSPLTDGDTGWRAAVGDVVWTGMFLVFAALVAVVAAILLGGRRRGT